MECSLGVDFMKFGDPMERETLISCSVIMGALPRISRNVSGENHSELGC